MIYLNDCPNTQTFEAFCKAYKYLFLHNKIMVSISGGADSDVMMDIIIKVAIEHDIPFDKISFVFFDTGIEYKATKEHLDYLEQKYNINIERIRAKVPVPLGCKKYGLPFISKDLSAKINSLQNNNFDFKNDGWLSYDELVIKYPKCKSVLKWWCNVKPSFNIKDNKYLKEFMIQNPPTFRISSRCCNGSKKEPSHIYEIQNHIDLKCLGLRKSEGGMRASKFKSCFSENTNLCDDYRPIWWFTDKDKEEYCQFFDIKHSALYEKFGFKRTGCAGCPFNSAFEEDLNKIKNAEPLLYKAVNNIFGASYDYTKAYKNFVKRRNDE